MYDTYLGADTKHRAPTQSLEQPTFAASHPPFSHSPSATGYADAAALEVLAPSITDAAPFTKRILDFLDTPDLNPDAVWGLARALAALGPSEVQAARATQRAFDLLTTANLNFWAAERLAWTLDALAPPSPIGARWSNEPWTSSTLPTSTRTPFRGSHGCWRRSARPRSRPDGPPAISSTCSPLGVSISEGVRA